MEKEVSVTALPWCWVIETLARSPQVGAAILYELLSKAPPLSGKSVKELREVVAFRCLKEIVGPSSELLDYHPTSHPPKAGFDTSKSCEDVLLCISRESLGFDLRKDASDELKWDLRSYIEVKKASFPRCSLELLKNLIVEGTHTLVQSLKEIRELTLPNECVLTITPEGVDPAAALSTINENGHGGQAMLAEENRVSPENGVGDRLGQPSLPNGNSSHSKRDTSSDRVQEADDTTHGVDNHEPPVKKLKLDKQDDVQSQQQASVPCNDSGMSDAAEDGQNHQSPKAGRKHNRKSNRENLGDRREVHSYSDNQPQTSLDNDGYHPRETDLARKMFAFLNSGSILADDSPTMTEPEVKLCMKCNNGGDLLICGANTCSLAFHESCLGCSASFDDQGKFYCPFCAYSRAISEYVKAKEKASLARRELSLFIGGRTSHGAQPDPTSASGVDVNSGRQNEDIRKATEPKHGVSLVTQVANRCQTGSSKHKQQEISSEDRRGADIIAQLATDTTRIENQRKANDNTDGGNSLDGNGKIIDTNEKRSNVEWKKDATGHQATEHQADVACESISDSDELSEDQKNKTTTSILSPRPLREVPVNHQSRLKRKKIHWTAEEEAVLKEGVQKFVQGDERAIPWKSILEFGGSVFQEGRRATDLKDKWRNIMKGSPKVK